MTDRAWQHPWLRIERVLRALVGDRMRHCRGSSRLRSGMVEARQRTTFKAFVTRYAWSGPILASVVVCLLGTGAIWQYFEFRLKSRTAIIEQVRAEKELYERLQLLQHQASDAIPRYIVLRERFFSSLNDRDVSSAYQAEKAKLLSLVREYNRIEAKLSSMEVRI